MRVAAAMACMLLSGCAVTPERAWQTLNAIDMGQTLHIARAPACYWEANPLTSRLIGRHPSEGEVVAVMVGYSLVHAYIADRLADLEDPRPLRVFQAATILISARNVIHNHQIGLRPFGSGGCEP